MSSLPFLLAQNSEITNWFTPIWLISVGIAAGFILSLLMVLKIILLQKVPWINSVTEKKGLWVALGTVTTLVYLGLFLGFCYWRYGASFFGTEIWFPLCFAIPICIVFGFGAWSLVARRMIGETGGLVREGFLGWINWVCLAMTVFAAVGFVLSLGSVNGFGVIKFVDEPMAFMNSLGRLPMTGTFSREFKIKPSPKGHTGDPIEIGFFGEELKTMSILSDRRLEMAAEPLTADTFPGVVFDILVREEPLTYRQRPDGLGKIPLGKIDHFYVNYFGTGTESATLKLTWTIGPVYSEATVIPIVALLVFGIYAFYLVWATVCPKVFAIAHATFKTEISQPLFLLVMIMGGVFVVGSIYIPYNTFGEDIKMYKDSGLTLIRILAIFLAIWAASKSVAEEIEGRTALTVLSKPVGRRQFIFGKFSGISLTIALMFIVLGLWFVCWVAYKPIYDYSESSMGLAEWTVCFKEAIHVIPGVFLCFLEVLIFVAISVAISTRMGILANFLICFSIYVLGHLTPLLVQSSLAAFEPVVVFGQLVAIVFPVLNHFDVQAAINNNSMVPLDYLGWSVIYTGLYGSMAMLFALVLFEDRDLA